MQLRIDGGIPITPEILPEEADQRFADTGGILLGAHTIQQERAAWCYAGCAAMIFDFYKKFSIRQCDVVNFIKKVECCRGFNSICIARGCDNSDFIPMYKNFGILTDAPPKGRILFLEVVKELHNEKRPIQIVVKWDGGGGSHALIIDGHWQGLLFVHDPLRLRPYGGWNHYNYIAVGFKQGRWDVTWTGIRKV
jgi:Papain-like cysteine protease AvrRpt2